MNAVGERLRDVVRNAAFGDDLGELRVAVAWLDDAEPGVRERVTAAADTPGDTDAGGLLPVLAAREVAVTDTAERMFPRTTSTRIRGVSDADGWNHGTAAADRARMGAPAERFRHEGAE